MLAERMFYPSNAFFGLFEDLVFPQSQNSPAHFLQLARTPFIASTIHRTFRGPVSCI